MRSIAEAEYGYFPSCHELFNNNLISGRAKLLVEHQCLDALLRLFKCITDQYALTKRQSIRFQYDWHFCCLQICKCRICIIKCLIGCRWDSILLHQVLGKCLRSFDNCCIGSWSKHTDSSIHKSICNTGNKRIIRSDDCKINFLFLCECNQFLCIHYRYIYTGCKLCNTCISRSCIKLCHTFALTTLPCNSMLSATATYDKYFHDFLLYSVLFLCFTICDHIDSCRK